MIEKSDGYFKRIARLRAETENIKRLRRDVDNAIEQSCRHLFFDGMDHPLTVNARDVVLPKAIEEWKLAILNWIKDHGMENVPTGTTSLIDLVGDSRFSKFLKHECPLAIVRDIESDQQNENVADL